MGKTKKKPKWKGFEELVARIQRDLAGDSIVTLNDKIIGKSGSVRQIDISIKKRVGQFNLLVVIECKDYSRPIDIKDVEAFIGLAKDVGAHKGALVSANGYSKAAKQRASQAGVEVYRAIDTGDHDWRAEVALPTVIEFTGPTKFSLFFRAVGDELFDVPGEVDPRVLLLFDEREQPLGTARDLIGRKWNASEIPEKPGEYEAVELAPNPLKYKVCGRFSRANITATVRIETRLHFGYWPISKLSGFFDELTGGTITREVKFDILSMEDVEKNWQRIASVKDLAVHPVATLRALDYPMPDDPLMGL